MEQYILKSAIEDEIERLHKKWEMGNYVYEKLISFLNTLEVKDVDIRSEVSNWWNNYYAGIKKDYTFEGYTGHYFDNSTIVSLAQYFYELGLKAQNKNILNIHGK